MSSSSNHRRCAACKHLRRRCSQDCLLAPYLPATHRQRFACVHQIFGASNVATMLQHHPVEDRGPAADAMATEAYWRVQDPVYGCTGIVCHLQQEIYAAQCELAKTEAQIAMYTALQAQQNDHPVTQAHASFLGSNQLPYNF